MSPAPASKLGTEGLAKMMPIITVVVALALGVAAYLLLFMPKIGQLLEGGALDVSPYEARIADDQAYLEELRAATKAYQEMNPERRQRVANIVTVGPDVPGIYVQIDAIARVNNLVLASIDAVPDEKSTTQAGRKSVRVAVNVAGGTYQQFKLFLADLERSERLFDVQAVVFTPSSGSYGVVLRAYYLDPPGAAPAAAAPTQP